MDYLFKLERKAFCSVSVKTGAKVFGFVSLLASILNLPGAAYILFANLIIHPKSFGDRSYNKPLTFLSLDVFVQLVQLITSILLLMGVYQEKPKLIPWWLVSSLYYVVIKLFIMPSIVMVYILMWNLFWVQEYSTVFAIIITVIELYGIWVVFRFYRILTSRSTTTTLSMDHQNNAFR